jgi:predicted ATPase/class 3 adenylate cyclase
MPDLPTGTVTFLFTDIEGSTRLWEQHPEAMRAALARHDLLLREAIEAHDGHVFKTMGDQFCAAFAAAPEALTAALVAQRALQAELWIETGPLRVRMALHTGAAQQRDADYFGPPLNRVARLLVVGHGGQILLSATIEGLVRVALPASAGLRALGAHRLKDLQQPEHLFQLLHPDLPADFPPLRSLSAFSHNLPVQLTRFIGREQEIAAVKRLLTTTHLLTFTGSGGCGKTRLALQVAADLVDEYADGVWLVELAALADPALVPQTVATVLGVQEQPSRPLAQALIEDLRPKSLLLVLDNCEHLLTATAQLAETLLRACPDLRILASSREGLNIAGETTYRLPSLGVPDLGRLSSTLAGADLVSALSHYEAVQLFSDRAAAVVPSFAMTAQNAPGVAQVCHRLDGIPLAIELAAARVRVLSVEQLASRLDDRFRLLTGGSRTALPRQQTLRALIDWSYDLLSEAERALLRRLSVFAGGWTLEAAEAVCSDFGFRILDFGLDPTRSKASDPPTPPPLPAIQNPKSKIQNEDVLDLLTGLVDKSLATMEEREQEVRYRLLETVRQYARDRLLEAGESEAVRERHLGFFLAWAEREDPDPTARADRLAEEHDNFRAALEWCRAQPGGATSGLRLMNALWWSWMGQSHIREGHEYLTEFLSRPEVAEPTFERARALNAAGFLATKLGYRAEARTLLEQSIQIARGLGREPFLGGALNNLGDVASDTGDHVLARQCYEESLAIRRKRGDQWGIAWSLIHLGRLARLEGNYEGASALDQESLALFRETGDAGSVAWACCERGKLCQAQDDFGAARACYAEALSIGREMLQNPSLPHFLEAVASLAVAQGAAERAARLYGAAERSRETKGTPLTPSERKEYERYTAAARAALAQESFTAAWSAGHTMTLEQAIEYALTGASDA